MVTLRGMAPSIRNIKMKTARTPLIVLTILIIGFLVFLTYSASLLPVRIASHFDGSGQPDGWMSRSEYLWTIAVLVVGISLLFIVPLLFIRRIPHSLVNIPNKEYWLSPEHKEEYISYISSYLLWMQCFIVVFFAGMHFLTIQANRSDPVQFNMKIFWPSLIGFVVVISLWSIVMIFHFKKIGKT